MSRCRARSRRWPIAARATPGATKPNREREERRELAQRLALAAPIAPKDGRTAVERRERKAKNDGRTANERTVDPALLHALEAHNATLKADVERLEALLAAAEARTEKRGIGAAIMPALTDQVQRHPPEASRPRPWRASPPSKSVDARDKLIASLNGSKACDQHVLAKPVLEQVDPLLGGGPGAAASPLRLVVLLQPAERAVDGAG